MAVALLPVCIFLPGDSRRSERAKLGLLSALLTGFFLFTGETWLPGGGRNFTIYAEGILNSKTLLPGLAQCDVGYPILILLSGYPYFHSIIPIFLIQATFAIASPLLIYEALHRFSPTLAFYTALAAITSLSGIYFMKMLFHDQTFIFFSILMICLLMLFVQTKHLLFLYGFAFAAIAASLTRPAGNLLFPIFLFLAFTLARGNSRHYLICLAIFFGCLGLDKWHRYVIFDMEHAAETPSYTGKQIFYNPYINSYDYGIRLSPEYVGPNTVFLKKVLYEHLKPDVTAYIQEHYVAKDAARASAQKFAEANMYPFTADEFIARVFTIPNWEYYNLLISAADDQVALKAAFEIARAYPTLIIRYSARNFYHFIFDPGYAHTRYNLNGFGRVGLHFYPADGQIADGESERLPPRVVREARFDPLSKEPKVVRHLFDSIASVWTKTYRKFVFVSAILMVIAWLSVIVSITCIIVGYFRQQSQPELKLQNMLVFKGEFIGCVLIASGILIYNTAVTAIFADPDFRYRHMVDLQVLLVAGLGLIAGQHWINLIFDRHLSALFAKRKTVTQFTCMQSVDVFRRLTATQIAISSLCLVGAIYVTWAFFMLHYTGQ